ncbi:kinesin-like protein KIF11 [Chanos chanos]|uniref:Kinesin-like protein KIF11 n=1 Tax=Chanos chanos TaxID=29144 RepID=A0A6J2WH19_CHACN|nr:kinesin-like protein KIF11 [Chanos chanos]
MSSSTHALLPGSKKDEKGRNIQVVVRCRPFNTVERKSASYGVVDCDQSRKEVTVRTGGVTDKAARKTYTFDMVFGPSAKQIEVYRSVVCPILDEVIMGYNCTIFAYGQTGTGKTFTMEGERSPNEEFTWEEDPLAGIIPRTLHQIFEKLSANGTEFSVKVSLLEIYNEELFDLLSPSPDVTERLQLFDDPRNKRGVIIKGLEEITVHNKNEVYQILERGAAKRKTASTLMNAYSSRSHSVFSVTIHMKEITLDGEELVKIGKLNLVDLAGSENIGRSGAVDKRAREAGSINQSLLTLGRVITALVERGPHIPYRESKLTRILQDSLGGRTKTSIIATISPASINLEETLSTLDYANRAKNIMNKPEVNQKLTKRTLIKEYTEEIERLKRDLAATRDKHGVYLSPENYESMNSKLVSQEEQITEYTEKITAMEEELKRVTELFSDSKQKLDQCTEDLQVKSQHLEEAHKDLQETRHKLSQEEFITTQLETTEEELYTTADQLLSTAEISTQDVSGLHAKLQRKREVEQHNSEVQQSFAQRMEQSYCTMQDALQQHGRKHQRIMDFYRNSVAHILSKNDAAFKEAHTAVASTYSGVKDLVEAAVTECKGRMLEQESLSVEAKNSMTHLLEEHKLHLEEVLVAQVLPGIQAVMTICDSQRQTLQRYHTLTERMEALKGEMSAFCSSQAKALAGMRDTAMEGFSSLQAKQQNLSEQISQVNQTHQKSIAQLMQCLQDQMNLLAMESQSNFDGLLKASSALRAPLDSLQNTIQSKCSEVEQESSSMGPRLGSSVDGLITEMHTVAEEETKMLDECSGYCNHLQSSLTTLADSAIQWCQGARDSAEKNAQDQLTLMQKNTDTLKSLQQNVEASGEALVLSSRKHLSVQQEEVEKTLKGVAEQTGKDEATLQLQREELSAHATSALEAVHSFLEEELKQDIPTGTTPQRKEYTYPRVLKKSRSRNELMAEFHMQQEQVLPSQCEILPEAEEEKLLDQDSLEDEGTSSIDSNITEPSYVDENLMCYENGRVPFFKKVNKKEKSLNRSKVTENEGFSTPPRSKLPLRSQN